MDIVNVWRLLLTSFCLIPSGDCVKFFTACNIVYMVWMVGDSVRQATTIVFHDKEIRHLIGAWFADFGVVKLIAVSRAILTLQTFLFRVEVLSSKGRHHQEFLSQVKDMMDTPSTHEHRHKTVQRVARVTVVALVFCVFSCVLAVYYFLSYEMRSSETTRIKVCWLAWFVADILVDVCWCMDLAIVTAEWIILDSDYRSSLRDLAMKSKILWLELEDKKIEPQQQAEQNNQNWRRKRTRRAFFDVAVGVARLETKAFVHNSVSGPVYRILSLCARPFITTGLFVICWDPSSSLSLVIGSACLSPALFAWCLLYRASGVEHMVLELYYRLTCVAARDARIDSRCLLPFQKDMLLKILKDMGSKRAILARYRSDGRRCERLSFLEYVLETGSQFFLLFNLSPLLQQ